MINRLTWPAAVSVLHSLVPSSRESIHDQRGFLPDTIADAAKEERFAVAFFPLLDYESRNDAEILQQILPEECRELEEAIVVTDESFVSNGPIQTRGNDLDAFSRWHQATLGHVVFDGDVIILFPVHAKVILFHHSGYYAVIDCQRE